MRPNITEPRLTTACLVACLAAIAIATAAEAPVPYPEGFRSWMVVKSMVVGPAHASFPNRGGLHHYYANDKAVAGYRTGTFPDGAIVVDEAVFTKEGEGTGDGAAARGRAPVPRRHGQGRASATRARADGATSTSTRDEKTGRLTDAERGTCATCHAKAPADHVFSPHQTVKLSRRRRRRRRRERPAVNRS